MSSVEILLTTTAFESSLGAEQGKIMARAMSDHIDHTGEFKFREVRSGWGVCEGVISVADEQIEAYPLLVYSSSSRFSRGCGQI